MVIKIIKKAVNTELQKELDEIESFLEKEKNLSEYIEKSLNEHRGLKAIKDTHNKLEMTYDEVIEEINLLASGLQEKGICHKDFVAFFSENNGRHFICNQAIIKNGACSVLRGTASPVEELEYIMKHADAKALIISDYKVLNKLKDIVLLNKTLKFIVVMFPQGEKPQDWELPIYTFDEMLEIGRNHEFVKPEISLNDNVSMMYTSGTTGMPKGVLISHKNLLSQVLPLQVGLGLKEGENSLQILPVWHAYEMTTQMLFFITGFYLHFTTISHLKEDLMNYNIDIFMSVPRIWEALRLGIYQKLKQKSKWGYVIFDAAIKNSIKYKRHKMYSEERTPNKSTPYFRAVKFYHFLVRSIRKPLHVYCTNKIYKKLKDSIGLNFRASFSGGGALSLQDELFYEVIGVNIRTGYGITETSPVLTLRHSNDKNYLCSVGKPIMGTEIKIVDSESHYELGIFQKGLVMVRGPQVMKGYYKDEQATEKVVNSEGWFNTGDLGWLTNDNHLVLVGRLKETIVLSSGENIEPVPIEEACLQSQYIEQIVLVGQDESSVGALVVPSKQALEAFGLAMRDISKGSNLSIKNPDLKELIKKEINNYIKQKPNLKSFEKIKNFEIIKENFNQENGLLSQTGKTKRNKIFDRYQEIISKMFDK